MSDFSINEDTSDEAKQTSLDYDVIEEENENIEKNDFELIIPTQYNCIIYHQENEPTEQIYHQLQQAQSRYQNAAAQPDNSGDLQYLDIGKNIEVGHEVSPGIANKAIKKPKLNKHMIISSMMRRLLQGRKHDKLLNVENRNYREFRASTDTQPQTSTNHTNHDIYRIVY